MAGTVYTPLYSGVFWDAQDYLLEDIDRIEVISCLRHLRGANADHAMTAFAPQVPPDR